MKIYLHSNNNIEDLMQAVREWAEASPHAKIDFLAEDELLPNSDYPPIDSELWKDSVGETCGDCSCVDVCQYEDSCMSGEDGESTTPKLVAHITVDSKILPFTEAIKERYEKQWLDCVKTGKPFVTEQGVTVTVFPI